MATCPVTVHALLHIADTILATGPVWASWSFPTERYCGKLQRAIHSRRYPFRNLDRFVLKDAALTHATMKFGLQDKLKLSEPTEDRGDCIPECAYTGFVCRFALSHVYQIRRVFSFADPLPSPLPSMLASWPRLWPPSLFASATTSMAFSQQR